MEEQTDYQSGYSELERFKKYFGLKHQDSLEFTPYFRYEIGEATHPYHLHFPERPTRRRYQNDIINLLCYFSSVEESIECLEYHYHHFEEKERFLSLFQILSTGENSAGIRKGKQDPSSNLPGMGY
jgi:hypothetical protein